MQQMIGCLNDSFRANCILLDICLFNLLGQYTLEGDTSVCCNYCALIRILILTCDVSLFRFFFFTLVVLILKNLENETHKKAQGRP